MSSRRGSLLAHRVGNANGRGYYGPHENVEKWMISVGENVVVRRTSLILYAKDRETSCLAFANRMSFADRRRDIKSPHASINKHDQQACE